MHKRLKFSSLAAAAALLIGAQGSAVRADDITVVSWGGAYTKSQIEAYHKPFTKKTGININSVDFNGGLAEVRAQVETGNITWDVVDVGLSASIRGCDEGILERIDPKKLPPALDGTPAVDDFIEGALPDCAVANIVWSMVAAFDKSKFADAAPKTMADFFDLKTFPGKRAMRKTPTTNLEMALIADGVAASDVYKVLATPEGVDRAFAKLDIIKDQVVWWEAGAQPPQLLADGEVVMTTAYNGRIFNAVAQEKKPFEIIWDGQVMALDLWVIPKGTKNLKAAMDFVSFSTDTQRLADQAKYISYGPARKSSSKLIGKHEESGIDVLPHLPTAPANLKNAVLENAGWWADHEDDLNERFNAWLVK